MRNKERQAKGIRYLTQTVLLLLLSGAIASASLAAPEPADEDSTIAQSLAEMLRDARAIISDNQDRINDPKSATRGGHCEGRARSGRRNL